MDSLLPAAGLERALSVNDKSRTLPLLCVRRGELVGDDLHERHHVTWQAATCDNLTSALGLLEVVSLMKPLEITKPRGRSERHARVLVEHADRKWKGVCFDVARLMAAQEFRPRSWTDLCDSSLALVRGGVRYDITLRSHSHCFSREVVSVTDAELVAACEIRGSRPADQGARCTVLAQRSARDQHWLIKLASKDHQTLFQDYPVVSGGAALEICERALHRGHLPSIDEIQEREDCAREAFLDHVAEASDAMRRLEYVREALNVPVPQEVLDRRERLKAIQRIASSPGMDMP
jgi:hypothetical protein